MKYLILAVLLLSASHSKALSLSGNYKEFEGIQSYNLAVNYSIFDYELIKSSKYFCESAEVNYKHNNWLGYIKIAEHSKSLNIPEQTASVGYQFINACDISVGYREDVTGGSILLRPACVYKLGNIIGKVAYIYTAISNIYSIKLKYELTDRISIAYRVLKFDADNKIYGYTAYAFSFGFEF